MRLRVLPGGLLDPADHLVEALLVGGAGVEPAAHQGRDGVDAVRLDGDLTEGGDGTGEFGLPAGGEHGLGVRQHGVAPVHEAGGAGVVGLAPEVEPPAAVRPDGAGDADPVAGEVERPSLLDVQLDEGADTGEPPRVGSDAVGVVSGGFHGPREHDPLPVGQPVRLLDGELPGGEPGPDTGEPEPGALLIPEVDDGEGLGELGLTRPQFIERGEGGHDSEGPVEGAPVGHGVEVRPGDDGVPLGGVPQPGPLVAVPVDLVGQSAGFGLLLEPGPALGVGPGPGEAPVAVGVGVPADGEQLAPHLLEGGGAVALDRSGRAMALDRCGGAALRHAPSPSRIGTRTPRSSATDSAMS